MVVVVVLLLSLSSLSPLSFLSLLSLLSLLEGVELSGLGASGCWSCVGRVSELLGVSPDIEESGGPSRRDLLVGGGASADELLSPVVLPGVLVLSPDVVLGVVD